VYAIRAAVLSAICWQRARKSDHCFGTQPAGGVVGIEIASWEHLTNRHLRRVMLLAFLAPRIVEAIAEGRQSAELSTITMTQRIELPPL
jgi:hypothetical protein